MNKEKAQKEIKDFEKFEKSGIKLTVAEQNYLRYLKKFLATN